MAFTPDTNATLKLRFLDWCEVADTWGNVTSVALDCLNRAQYSLWEHRPWADLRTRLQLTMSGKTASLPDTFGRMLSVWHDSDSDGRPDFYYYERSNRADDGYYITPTFAKASGYTWTITFYASPNTTPYIEYQKRLTDFAGTGTEYSYFPGDLLLTRAKRICMEDGHRTGEAEYGALVNREEELLVNYEALVQHNNADMRMEQLDDGGQRIDNEGYNLGSGSDGVATTFDPDYDLRG